MPKTKTITMKHLTVSLWNVQLACDAIRQALESMDPTGKSKIVLPLREGRIIEASDHEPRMAGDELCCPPPPDAIRRRR